MNNANSCVTIHMAASLDGFIARGDERVDWLETSDEFADGEALDRVERGVRLQRVVTGPRESRAGRSRRVAR